jgi:hypothetical protein
MKTLFSGIGILGVFLFLASPGVWGQTSLLEINTTLKGMEDLNGISGGPSVGGARPAGQLAPVSPRPGIGGPVPDVVRPTGPSGPASPAAKSTAPTTTTRVGTRRKVLAPENGFVPTTAAQLANLGFEHMREMRFEEAREAYRRAKELDSRYNTVYQGIVHFTTQITRYGIDSVAEVEIAKEPLPTTIADYYGWPR